MPRSTMMMLTGAMFTCAAHALAGSCNQATLPYELVELEGLTPPFTARGLNNASQVAGVMTPNTLFRWQDGQVLTYQVPGVALSAEAFSESGLIAGSYVEVPEQGEPQQRTFIWDPDASTFDIIETDVPIFPFAINDDALIAGIAENKYGFALDTRTADLTALVLDGIPDQNVGAAGGRAVSTAGAVVGSDVVLEGQAYRERPYLWTQAGGVIELPSPDSGGRALDINDAGTITGVANDGSSGFQLATWDQQTHAIHIIGVPAGYFVVSNLAGINNEGIVAFDVPNDFFGFTRSFLWDGNCFIDLTASIEKGPSANIVNAWAINDAGEVLVLAEMPQGNQFMIARPMTPIPVVPGDYDADGDVDSADLNVLLAAFGCQTNCDADLTGDDAVTSADLNILLSNFGA